MFVWTFRKGGIKKIAAITVCGMALVASAVGISTLWQKADAVDVAATQTGMTQQITGAEDLKTFLIGYGLEIDPTAAEVATVKIPRKWDENFKAFHDVILQSGLDLSKCKNKQVDKWTVLIPGQSDEQQKTYAVVLVYKNEPKGAYLLQKPSGEVKPLVPTATASLPLTEEELAANAEFGSDLEEPAQEIQGEVVEEVDAELLPDAQETALVDEAAIDKTLFPTE